MKKKKKGSSFIIVVIIMAILFTTGTTILTLAGSDYKMRVNSSKKLENMYAADSGLDVVYNIILKNSEAAIIYANQKIGEKYNGQEMTNELYEKINIDFKNEFINFLGTESLEAGKSNTDAILSQGIKELKYMQLKEENSVVSSSFKNPFVDDTLFDWKDIDADKKYEIEILEYDYDDSEKTIKVKVQSMFETVDKEIKNKKILETKYTVSTPDYKEPVSSDSVLIDIYPVFDGKVITADGNLSLNGNVDVKGDIWVKGNYDLDGENPAYAFDKYRGGISVEKGKFNIEGNVITNRTLHVDDLGDVDVNGNVYALNAYVGSLVKGKPLGKTKLSINVDKSMGGDLIVNNDLSSNSAHSNIKMNNFYGINETMETSINNIDKAMKSSSIIVNDTNELSTLTVLNDTYIMGVAYIDTVGDKYQTGESVAVKGNYKAYSEVLPDYEDKVTLKYYNPLHLIESIDGKSKAEYFTEYYKENKESIANGGIKLNNVYSTGAYVKKNETEDSSDFNSNTVSNGDSEVVNNRRYDFARNVFSMGNTNGVNKTDEVIYKDNKVIKAVENQIDFTKIDDDKVINEDHGMIKLNKNKDKTVVIKGKGDNSSYDKINYSVIDASEDVKALVITNGDVILTGEINFKGNIIAQGNVILENKNFNDKKNIAYDSDVTRKIIASNYDYLNEILKIGSTTGQQSNISTGDKVNIDTSADGYNLKGLVDNSNWKIIK